MGNKENKKEDKEQKKAEKKALKAAKRAEELAVIKAELKDEIEKELEKDLKKSNGKKHAKKDEKKSDSVVFESAAYRAEIISNQSIQDDVVELLEQEIPEIQYTIIPDVHGKGMHSKKLGDTTWPEQNFCLFAYVSLEDAKKIKAIIKAVKAKFANEGISLYFTQVVEI